MKKNKFIFILTIAIILILALIVIFFIKKSEEPFDSISKNTIITYNDENSSIVIKRNTLEKTAVIEIEMYFNQSELDSPLIDVKEYNSFALKMFCGLLSLTFFNQTGLEELNIELQKWNNMPNVIVDENGNNMGRFGENPISGYNVNSVEYKMVDKEENKIIGSCIISGPSEEDIIINLE